MARIGYDPHIIVLDNGIWRTHDKNGKPLKPTFDPYPPNLKRPDGSKKSEDSGDASGSTDSKASSE